MDFSVCWIYFLNRWLYYTFVSPFPSSYNNLWLSQVISKHFLHVYWLTGWNKTTNFPSLFITVLSTPLSTNSAMALLFEGSLYSYPLQTLKIGAKYTHQRTDVIKILKLFRSRWGFAICTRIIIITNFLRWSKHITAMSFPTIV